MQLAIHGTDQCKLFPVIVLLEYARVSQASYCAILGCLGSDSDSLRRADADSPQPQPKEKLQ